MSGAMDEPASPLTRAVRRVIETVEPLTEEQWGRICPAEGWTVGLTAFHLALGIERQAGWIEGALRQSPPRDFSWTATDEMNAALAKAEIEPSKQFVVAALNGAAERLAGVLRKLTDDDLDRPALTHQGKALPVRHVMRTFVRHVDEHLASIGRAGSDA